ncbi:type I phosphodiesterase/nucleotide pyrophosphatase [Leptospira ryugenii]|uniref:Type I phosphodiesterase/nucleotide pyrophosphatase n=1 Tax=Leptospira ryugenii TaxID=1917863 RepID=A0A2P2E367_9LEPT|nr:alkaline phosphatase family protein [Leptospira ryugenii]GBF51317.1 type I phosphodiesterase/nucleotide pyrophosphatase [Leptospira ryugenii]
MSHSRFLYFIVIFLTINLHLNCLWEREYKEAAKYSIQKDTDLILVPFPNYIFDNHSRESFQVSNYNIDDLKDMLIEHEISLDDLKQSWGINEDTKDFSKEVNYTSHYTHYPYDYKIPIWIYGPNWVRRGVYPDEIYQQHIPGIASKFLGFKFSNSLDLKNYEKIFIKTNEKPQIIVTIVIDQAGTQLYRTHKHSYPFLKELSLQSAYFPNAKVMHLEAHTAVGHAAIGTGSFPKDMGIHSNEVYFFQEGQVKARKAYEANEDRLNLSDMRVNTLADEWDVFQNNKPVIISQCYAARASIGMAGHGSLAGGSTQDGIQRDKDIVLWQDGKSLQWATFQDAYQLPKVVESFQLYEYYLKNSNRINSQFRAKNRSEFQQKLSYFQASEYQVKMDGELFRAMIETEIIDKNLANDGITDLVYLTLKATDAVGHRNGWESKEAKKILEETDLEVRRIFDFLRSHYGDSFLLFVTADHGAAPMPEVSGASVLTHKEFFTHLSDLLPKEERNRSSVIKWVTHSQVSLNRDVLSKFNLSEGEVIQKIKEIKVNGKPFFRKVWKISELD